MSIDSDKLVIARLEDAIRMAETKNIPSFLGFLNSYEFSVCKSILDKDNVNYFFSGGFDEAERVFISILPDWADEVEFPFVALRFEYKDIYNLSHRDFLGTLMSLGIERDKIGDIIVNKGKTFAFVSNSIARFCIENITKVGGVGVTVCLHNGEVSPNISFETISKTVASNRADCVVAAICNFSREKAKDFIFGGNLIVNHIVCESTTKLILNNDVLSLRKFGKFVVLSIDEKTRKGRNKLILKKYIWKGLFYLCLLRMI